MANLPLALSVHHFIDSVGADAGFAAIIGLAILVLLYFAQARETANLREQAYESAQRVAQLEARLTSLARQQAAAAQVAPAARVGGMRAPAPAPAPAFAGAVAMAPGPPAGVAAPALSAATRLIPAVPIAEPEPPVPEQGAPEPDEQPVDNTALGGLPPATAAAAAGGNGGNGASQGGVTSPPRVTPPPRGVLPPVGAGRPAQAARRPGAASAAAGRGPVAPPPRFSEPPRRRLGLRIAMLAVGALVIAAIVVALLHFTNSGGSSPNSTRASNTSNAPSTSTARHKRTATVVPSAVTVSVLNGTATNGLAGRISSQLSSAGYKPGRVATASDQTRTATIVAYMPGHKTDALAVAKSLKLGPASVQPVDPATQAVACTVSTQCTSQVVVTVGTDLAA
ncbi:MAG: LytR C-terminal domain-containing protein [Solirubrobacteraceae bacterium]